MILKRYDCEGCHSFCYGGYHMEEQAEGDYVRYADVEQQLTRLAPLEEAVVGATHIVDTAGAEIRMLRGRALPAELTPPLRRVLGMMLWETGPIAHAMRATGRDIARKAEDEQAIVLHWLIGFVLEHGADWEKHAAIALRQMTDTQG